MIKKHLSCMAIAFFLFISGAFGATFFSGYAGGKLNYIANPDVKEYDPELKLQAFFAGQFNFSQNFWSHIEFSVDTQDFLNQSLFHATPSMFQVDEISFIFRGNLYEASNYFSLFMGTYDPVGSDVFLQRYFTIKPISSKITESYLGLAGSILYPHFGVGISNVLRFHPAPIALGGYVYINHEDVKNYVLNTDLRFANVLRYFTFDFAAGVGIPLENKYKGNDVIVAIEKIYWHAGTTILLGNNYTQSLFLQAGIYNASFVPQGNSIISPDDFYILLEPRFLFDALRVNISIFCLPKDTVKKLLLVDDTLGANLNIYLDSFVIGSQPFTIGAHAGFSLIDKTFLDLKEPQKLLNSEYNINITPYIYTNFLSGEIHIQSKIRLMDFINGDKTKAFSIDLGYRTKF
ncbi:hypothetical protein [Treponema sp. Marseille-Q3903]|uniref:hypothetical protein n=1 Tax=Treponema sp. Marseille-Q3903 TaxID=2766703 RepID=UPI00165201A1|nr:hypothetical protein [Treponema sp. Marseille-Q3903]MBC6714010.1 hypothetical protein [Treponema sp. Marseille-Q3903]